MVVLGGFLPESLEVLELDELDEPLPLVFGFIAGDLASFFFLSTITSKKTHKIALRVHKNGLNCTCQAD